MNKEKEIGKIIRIITVAPIMALVMLTIIFKLHPGILVKTSNYVLSIIFLTVLPLLAYPLQPLLPKYKDKGRDGQRNLAIIMAVLGYLFGITSTMFFHASKELLLIYLTYFFFWHGYFDF